MSENNEEQQTDQNKVGSRAIIIGGVAVVAVIVVAVMLNKSDDNDVPNPNVALSQEDARTVLDRKFRGLALMENASYAEAAGNFEQILEIMPDQPLAIRNRAIAWVLAISPDVLSKDRDTDLYLQYLGNAQTAVTAYYKQSNGSPLARFLAARFLEHFDVFDPPKGFTIEWHREQELEAAANGAMTEPTFWCDLYEYRNIVAHNTSGKSADALLAAKDAIAKAHELEPDNIYASIELMLVLADVLNKEAKGEVPKLSGNKAQQLDELLENLEETLKPFFASIKKMTRQDMGALIAKARGGIAEKKWNVVLTNCRFIGNCTRPEVAFQIDRRRIRKHLLEFVQHDFEATTKDRLQSVAALPTTETVAVKFQTNRQLNIVQDIVALRIADFDLDQTMDLFVAHDDKVTVIRERAISGFTSIAQVQTAGPIRGLIAYDLDLDDRLTPTGIGYPLDPASAKEQADPSKVPRASDADIDVVAFGDFGVSILVNQFTNSGKRKLFPTEQSEAFNALRNVLDVIAVDFDHDADLDLVVSSDSGISVWANHDDLTFHDVSENSVLPPKDVVFTKMLALDWNRNVDVDIILTGKNTKPYILESAAHGRFRARELEDDFSALANVRGIVFDDIDRNASWDFITVGSSGTKAVYTSNTAAGVVSVQNTSVLSKHACDGVVLVDYDNDGDQDLVTWSANEVHVIHREEGTSYAESKVIFSATSSLIQFVDATDIDGDGDLDLVITTGTTINIATNNGGNKNNSLQVVVRGDPDRTQQRKSERINVHAIGSLMELKAGDIYQPRIVDRQVMHFGIGQREQADVIRMLWTNGIPLNIIGPHRGAPIVAQQKLMGSCPYIYTWDGEEYTFFSDCLWAAPIGLQLAEHRMATPREWEYLKIPGNRLKPTDGEYRLQLTEELWEAAYFDHVELIAIDHPPGVDIYSNEKVGPSSIAEYKIHTVKNRRLPVSAKDKHGRDVLPQLAEADDVYLKAFDEVIKQGLTDEHYIELDLGQLEDPKQITLFLTGWIFPTDSSINVSLTQNSTLPLPKPPAVWVPNEDGEFQEVIPYMGFPGGKTKTIAVDLSKAFLTDDYRIRIVTGMEIYWNAAFFSVDEDPVELKRTSLPLIAAESEYRGFSKRLKHPQYGPENYDHRVVSKQWTWPPMQGRFTKFGDVTELLKSKDDCSVVLASGDAVTIRFQADDGPPEGWERDFILHCTGWDKDANLNTLYGQTVEPLPFRAMRGYPDMEGAQFPDSQKHREYLKKFQTRRVPRASFWTEIRDYRAEKN